jgi:hypothetical protein
MRLHQFTKLFFFCWFLLSGLDGFAIADSTKNVSLSPYRDEYNPWFTLTKFQRGFDSDSLRHSLNILESKPRKEWNRQDSLEFAQSSLQTGNIALSNYYFEALSVDYDTENVYWWEQMMLFIQQKEYEAGIESIHKSVTGRGDYSKIYFIDRLLLSYLEHENDDKWYRTHRILKWDVDSTLLLEDKSSERFKSEVLIPLENLNFVLHLMIHYIHADDAILASACYEMGIILENHVSLTQAYIAYSLGRNYNKWDKRILKNIKAVKAKLSEKKYKIPIFRRYFPRIEKWRFEYEVLKEKLLASNNDTLVEETPQMMVPKKEIRLPFRVDLVIVIGVFLLIILVIFFLKTNKK